jgi:hypothetical protein
MGLNVSHGAFSGSYVAFNNFRSFICESAGGSWQDHFDKSLDPDLWYVDSAFNKATHPGLWELLLHEDHTGKISPSACVLVARDLEELLPVMLGMDSLGFGCIARNGGYVATVKKFIAGCWSAAAVGESLIFS